MWGREGKAPTQGWFISHKKWREEGRLNERIKEGGRGGTKRGQAAVTKQAEKGDGAQTRLDCLSCSAAFALRQQRGQRSVLNDVVLLCWVLQDCQLHCWLRQIHRDYQYHLHSTKLQQQLPLSLQSSQWFSSTVLTWAFTVGSPSGAQMEWR